jgi:hypothetical protein
MKRHVIASVAAVLGLILPVRLAAQAPGPRAQRPAPPAAERPEPSVVEQSADVTRDELSRVLEQYPPSLPQVLRLDPTLLNNTDYLTLYPNLASYLTRHPEVAHNPNYYLAIGRGRFVFEQQPPNARREALQTMENVLGGLAGFSAFVLVLSLTAWGLKTFVEHRRWLRVLKIQTDAHSKLLDRLTSNEDLLAYIQSPAGRQFLEAAPLPTAAPRAAISAPVNRILWSVQAGIVLALGGAGLWYARSLVIEEVAQPLAVLGALNMFLGAGFVISALVAYVLSKLLGLFDAPTLSRHA